MIPTTVAIVGIIITVATTNIAARYFALFLMLAGTYSCFQVSNAWMANIAARPQKKRAIGLAINNSIGNLSLVWTPYLYPESDGPRYVTAWAVNLALSAVVVASSLVLHFLLKRDNNGMDEADAAGYSIEEAPQAKTTGAATVERFDEHVTVGRRLGGQNEGATARYQT